MATVRGKLVDFNSAYAKRHGHAPKPPGLRGIESRVEPIIRSCGGVPENILAALDLETDSRYEFVAEIRSGDTVVAKAGRGFFQITFIGIDSFGMLVAKGFSGGLHDYEHHIAEGEEDRVKVWGGMLPDFRCFEVTAERLPLHQDGNGILARVRITALADDSEGPFYLEPA
jgi:hypothetical protein